MALNSNQVKSLQAGVHADGGGLYVVVRESGDRVWAFRFTDLDGKRAQMEFAEALEPPEAQYFWESNIHRPSGIGQNGSLREGGARRAAAKLQ